MRPPLPEAGDCCYYGLAAAEGPLGADVAVAGDSGVAVAVALVARATKLTDTNSNIEFLRQLQI